MTAWGLVMFCISLTICVPTEYIWNRLLGIGSGKCMDAMMYINIAIGFSATDIAHNVLFAVLPLPMLWNIQISRRTKLAIFIILSLGALSVVLCSYQICPS